MLHLQKIKNARTDITKVAKNMRLTHQHKFSSSRRMSIYKKEGQTPNTLLEIRETLILLTSNR